jgi:hypothetical protein
MANHLALQRDSVQEFRSRGANVLENFLPVGKLLVQEAREESCDEGLNPLSCHGVIRFQ